MSQQEAIALQMFVTGMVMGGLMKDNKMDIEIKPVFDSEGNYEPKVLVTSNITGTRLKITVEIDDDL